MAYTKHIRLAKSIKNLLDNLEDHFQKTARALNFLQLFFYETHLIIGRPLMDRRTLKTMMYTYLYGLRLLSSDKKIRESAESLPPIFGVLTPPIYPASKRIYSDHGQLETAKWVIPWHAKGILPDKNIEKLNDTKLAAVLYCASPAEMSNWNQWFDQEDKAGSLTNTLFAIDHVFHEMRLLEINLCKLARPFYKEAILEFYSPIKDPKELKTLLKIEFAPDDKTNLFDAYQKNVTCLRKRRKKHFEDFQRFWRAKLERLIFENLNWSIERKNHFLKTYFPAKKYAVKKNYSHRWETSKSLDRQSYGAFINHFSKEFLINPLKNHVEGEIALFLWTTLYISRVSVDISIQRQLKLTTADVSGQFLLIDGNRIKLSLGLANLIQEYLGKELRQRHHKLFPNLNIDKLEDHLRNASSKIFSSKATLALPEAFQAFPHPQKGRRITLKDRHYQKKNPPQVFYNPISYEEIKKQLSKKL